MNFIFAAVTQPMKTLSNCPICDSADLSKAITSFDHTVSKQHFDISRCNACGFHFTNPQPEPAELGKYYESDDYISHSDSEAGLVNKIYKRVRKITLKRKLNLVNRLSAKGKLLDVGCGTGYFLDSCKTDGWDTTGIEPGKQAREYAISKFGLNVLEEEKLNTLTPHSFDVITMWHVLEHVPFLNERVAELKQLLKPGGTLIVAVPNRTSHDAKHYGEHWAAWDVPRHLWHFSPDDIRKLFAKASMEVKEILPMNFDAYYVSLLSEKYKNGKSSYFSAFRSGWVSNSRSNTNPPTCSSQIYIIGNK